MRRKYLLITLLFLKGTVNLFAQYDAGLFKKLTHDLQTAGTNVQKITAMLAVGDYYVEQSYMEGFRKSMDTAYSYARSCEQLARKMKSDEQLAKTYQLYSKAYNYESKYDTCISYAQKAIDIFTTLKDNAGLCHARRTMYRALRYTQLAPDIKPYLEQSLALAQKTRNSLLMGIANEDFAQNERYSGRYKASLVFITDAIKCYQQAGKKDLQHCYALQALMFLKLQHLKEAYASITQAISLAEEFKDDSFDMIYLYSCGGEICWAMKRWETGEVLAAKAMKVARKYTDPLAIMDQAMSLLDIYRQNNKPKEALEAEKVIEQYYSLCDYTYQLRGLADLVKNNILSLNFEKADKYYKAMVPLLPGMPSPDVMAEPAFSVGHALAFYFQYKNNADSCQKYLNLMIKANNVPNTDYSIDFLPIVHYTQFYIDSLRGNYVHAIKELHLYEVYKDSIFDLRKHGQITEMEVKYDVEKRKRDNELLKRETELQAASAAKATTQKNWSLAAVLLLAIIVLLVVRQYRLNQKSKQEIADKNNALEQLVNEKDELLEEKDWLLKEIHHRVKNNLQMVMSLLNTQSYFLNDEAAKEAIMNSQHRIHSMSLIHKKLYQSDNIAAINMAVYFSELIDYYQVAFDTGNRIVFHQEVDRVNLDASQAVPVGLILNEAVTNALKHAFPDKRAGGISIRFKELENNQLLFSVKDNGVGIPGDVANAQVDSLGMKLIKGFAGDLSADLTIASENGLEITLRFTNNKTSEAAFAAAHEPVIA